MPIFSVSIFRDQNVEKMSKWTKDIDKLTAAFKTEFGGLTEEALNWKPAPDRWSIAQNLDHLIRINESYFPVISNIRQHTYKLPWYASFSFVSRFFGNMLLKAVQPHNRKKTKTFGIWEPAKSSISGDILNRFEKHQTALKQLMEQSKDLLEQRAVISSPASKYFVYKLDTAFDILVAHEKRHLEQAREVLTLMQAKSSAAA